MNFDSLRVAEWVIHQVKLAQITDPERAAFIERHCQAIAKTGLGGSYRFSERPELFWRGLARGNRCTPGLHDGTEPRDFLLRISDSHYHPLLRQFLIDNKVPLDSAFPATPEEVGFVLAGGSLEDEGSFWRLHPLYDGSHPFEGRDRSLCADDDGDHFTQSAGWVGVRTDNQFVEDSCVIQVLRWVAFSRFGYDPDHYFADGPHDQFGFVENRGGEPIIL